MPAASATQEYYVYTHRYTQLNQETMGLGIIKNNIAKKIATVGKEAQSLIDLEFQKTNYEPQSNSPLNQEGMKNGFEQKDGYRFYKYQKK